MKNFQMVVAAVLLLVLVNSPGLAQDTSMSFFVTSVGSGDGGNLGGLIGADAHCQQLAAAVGAGNKTWVAYLSQSQRAVTINARDRIGNGPWYSPTGIKVADNIEDLHSDSSNVTGRTSLTERGEEVSNHDILTGSQPDGTAFPFPMMDMLDFDDHTMTCGNWASNDSDHWAMIGHSDRDGSVGFSSWNGAHPIRSCNQADGGTGFLFYCFAID